MTYSYYKKINTLMLLLSIFFIILASLADLFSSSTSGFGFIQKSIFVIGGILSAFYLRRIVAPEKIKWDWLFVVFYLSGLLYAGLWPNNNLMLNYNHFLDFNHFNLQDFSINLVGFAPFGFLLMAALRASYKISHSIVITMILSVSVSLLIESLQYCCIAGRYSSGYDLLSNSAAGLFGILFYLVYERICGFNKAGQEFV